jgi:hypothetical protein
MKEDITIDIIMSNINDDYELTKVELQLLLDVVKDKRVIPNTNIRESHHARSIEQDMYDICELFEHKIKFQPERIKELRGRFNNTNKKAYGMLIRSYHK